MDPLPKDFRKLSVDQRRLEIEKKIGTQIFNPAFGPTGSYPEETLNYFQKNLEMADIFVENSVGVLSVPIGIAPGLPLNDKFYNVPMATEEPSVIAAASYAFYILSQSEGGGISSKVDPPCMTSQVYLEFPTLDLLERQELEKTFQENRYEIDQRTKSFLLSMEMRGGGFRSSQLRFLEGLPVVCFDMTVDVRDAMGANLLNTLAESMAPYLEETLGGHKILAILSNDASLRVAHAQFKIPASVLAKSDIPGEEVARRIVLASRLAETDYKRAITHNKGIMNGIEALALATGNDTRALSAGVHAWAARSGSYKSLSTYEFQKSSSGAVWLQGKIDLPLALATVGGCTTHHPVSKAALALLGNPNSVELCSIAASLGLAQNFAALYALVTEGIQKGHMKLQNKRLSL